MKQNNKNVIEEHILKITKELLYEWEKKFKKISINIDIPFIYRNNNELEYYSEIETNFWYDDGSFATVFSIIIFMQNKQILNIKEAKNVIQEEVEVCYDECINNNN